MQFALGLAVLFGVRRKRFHIVVRPHLVHARIRRAARYETARIQLAALALAHGHALAREHAFVHFDIALYHHRVGGDLFAHFEIDHVVEHHVRNRHGAFFAVADHHGGGRGDKIQLIYRAFALDLLHDTDRDVRQNDHQEKELAGRGVHRNERARHHEYEQIEKRENVGKEDAPVRLAALAARHVDKAVRLPLFHLKRSEPAVILRLVPFGGGIIGIDHALFLFFAQFVLAEHGAVDRNAARTRHRVFLLPVAVVALEHTAIDFEIDGVGVFGHHVRQRAQPLARFLRLARARRPLFLRRLLARFARLFLLALYDQARLHDFAFRRVIERRTCLFRRRTTFALGIFHTHMIPYAPKDVKLLYRSARQTYSAVTPNRFCNAT